MSGHRMLGSAALALCASALAGCASPDRGAVSDAARELYTAVVHQDGAAGCAALTPKAAASLESGGSRCAQEVVKLQLSGGPVRDVQVWGDRARLRAGTDTVFLADLAGAGWRVAAAGCQKRAGGRYECEVEA